MKALALTLVVLTTSAFATDFPQNPAPTRTVTGTSGPIIHPATPRSAPSFIIPARIALNLRIPELSVDSISLAKCIDFLRDSSGANIVVSWKALEAAGIVADTP